MNRPDLFVYLALVAAWVLVAAWAYRIGGKVNHLQEAVDSAVDAAPQSPDAL